MRDIPHRQLTRPKKVFEFFFDGAVKSTAQEGSIKLEPIADGQLNAVCFWFDLHLDEEATITTAPPGFGKFGEGGQVAVDEQAVRRRLVFASNSAVANRIGFAGPASLGRSHAGAQPPSGCGGGRFGPERLERVCRQGALLGPGSAVLGAQSAGGCMRRGTFTALSRPTRLSKRRCKRAKR